jgi:hypothetical protein
VDPVEAAAAQARDGRRGRAPRQAPSLSSSLGR